MLVLRINPQGFVSDAKIFLKLIMSKTHRWRFWKPKVPLEALKSINWRDSVFICFSLFSRYDWDIENKSFQSTNMSLIPKVLSTENNCFHKESIMAKEITFYRQDNNANEFQVSVFSCLPRWKVFPV